MNLNQKLPAITMFVLMWSLPFVQVVTDNTTLNVLASIFVWGVMLLTAVAGLLAVYTVYQATAHTSWLIEAKEKRASMTVFKTWTNRVRAYLCVAITVSIYVYVEWTGPIIVYLVGVISFFITVRITRNKIDAMDS